ncbi:hypothetical protein GUY44_06930 [Pimelobacter simplex]|uniref:Uncharacterized protein n=1 Tax=Nocardioides simplex TaxID=2045 RepID=A0A0A1DK07_NOCSI|nr:hypothetical protein [Pimelobacter simplex]AIY17746.1 hypothetical protein KR76_15025 [Pimelobacter simplex]MCG8150205.1 hypothetical protein [Pimelobacter simplex]GEB13585.1 hypothetical protein NSI01_19000 [Pimelobacter simplex]SFM71366.1 hypothetical protein SAMN05421671_3086 [Pimelobacter simplex]
MTETNTTSKTPTVLYADKGPVLAASRVLVESSTLDRYVEIISPGVSVDEIRWTGGTHALSIEQVGTGTAALWKLLASICHSGPTVSLHDTISHLDLRNRAAVARAINVLVGFSVVA